MMPSDKTSDKTSDKVFLKINESAKVPSDQIFLQEVSNLLNKRNAQEKIDAAFHEACEEHSKNPDKNPDVIRMLINWGVSLHALQKALRRAVSQVNQNREFIA